MGMVGNDLVSNRVNTTAGTAISVIADGGVSGAGVTDLGSSSIATPVLFLPFVNFSVPTIGTAVPTFTRNSVATFEDFEGMLRTAIANEIRFQGARRVQNLFANSASLLLVSTTSGNASGTVSKTANTLHLGANIGDFLYVRAVPGLPLFTPYVIRVVLSGTGTVKLYFSADDSNLLNPKTVVLSSTPTIYTVSGSNGSVRGNYTGYGLVSNGTACDVNVSNWQCENVTGQANQNPAEYVSVGVLSAPYSGAGVDGVKYFPYLNGNTVSSNVVTEAIGAPISAAILQGQISEVTATNTLQQSRNFDNVYWQTASSVTVTADQAIAPDGVTTADKITEVATTATHRVSSNNNLGTSASANTTYTLSCFYKKGTRRYMLMILTDYSVASVTQWIDLDNGILASYTVAGTTLAYVNASITSVANGFYRCTLTVTTGASFINNLFSLIGLASADGTSTYLGDISQYGYIWGAQLEVGSFSTSFISTSTASVTRAADVLSYPTTNNLPTNNFTILQSWTPEAAAMGTVTLFGSYTDASNYLQILHDGTNASFRKRLSGTNYDATILLTYTAGTTYRIAARQSGTTGMDIFVNAYKGANNSNTTNAVVASAMQIGANGNSLVQDNGANENVMIYNTALSDAAISYYQSDAFTAVLYMMSEGALSFTTEGDDYLILE